MGTPLRPIAVACLVLTLAAFALYAWGAAPTVLYGDSAEFQIVGARGGIPHATGYPTFVLAGRLLGWFGWGDPAHRITLLCSAFAALSVGLVALVLRTLGVPTGSAVAAAAIYGLSFTVWRVGQRAETYAVSIALTLLAAWAAIVALRTGRTRDTLVAGFLLGLVMTCHLTSAMLVAVLGLALAWRTFRARPPAAGRLAALAGAFALGWTPYLYLVWADGQPGGFNYLRIVDSVVNPIGAPMPAFDSPWERVLWLVRGMNRYDFGGAVLDPTALARGVAYAVATLFLFELGPLVVVLAAAGIACIARDARRFLLPVVIGLAAMLLYVAAFGSGVMTGVYLLPVTAAVAVLAGFGIDHLRERLGPRFAPRGAAAWALGAGMVLAVALPAHALRVRADSRPLPPLGLQVREDLSPRDDRTGVGRASGHHPGLVPSMRDLWEPRRFGESVLAAAPPGALLVATWGDYTNLLYLQMVEGRRPDLTIEIMSPEGLPERLARWRRDHPGPARPIVFVSRPPGVVGDAPLDSVSAGAGTWLYRERRGPAAAPGRP